MKLTIIHTIPKKYTKVISIYIFSKLFWNAFSMNRQLSLRVRRTRMQSRKRKKFIHMACRRRRYVRLCLFVCNANQMEIFGGTKRVRTGSSYRIVREKPRGFYLVHMSVMSMMFSHKTHGKFMTGILDRNNLIYACETKWLSFRFVVLTAGQD